MKTQRGSPNLAPHSSPHSNIHCNAFNKPGAETRNDNDPWEWKTAKAAHEKFLVFSIGTTKSKTLRIATSTRCWPPFRMPTTSAIAAQGLNIMCGSPPMPTMPLAAECFVLPLITTLLCWMLLTDSLVVRGWRTLACQPFCYVPTLLPSCHVDIGDMRSITAGCPLPTAQCCFSQQYRLCINKVAWLEMLLLL